MGVQEFRGTRAAWAGVNWKDWYSAGSGAEGAEKGLGWGCNPCH